MGSTRLGELASTCDEELADQGAKADTVSTSASKLVEAVTFDGGERKVSTGPVLTHWSPG